MPLTAHLSESATAEEHEKCRALQAEEYEVLESIYPECISLQGGDGFMRLQIPIEFEVVRSVYITTLSRHSRSSPDQGSSLDENISVDSLPPLILQIQLPKLYPLHSPPDIISVGATDGWLHNVSILELQRKLSEKWEVGDSVLYHWIEYLRTGEFIPELELTSLDGFGSIRLHHPDPPSLAHSITSYNTFSKSEQFSRNSYSCSICLTSFKGAQCHQLSCGHIFCQLCLEDFWGMCIQEGDVGRVGCPDPRCVKDNREAAEQEVSLVVSEAQLQRWKWLREKRTLEQDPNTMNCPIPTCQTLVSKPDPGGTDPESGWDRFRQCSRCSFSFCSFCKYTWHGPLSACPVSHTEQLVQKYLAAEENSAERTLMERCYGRSLVIRLITAYEEDKATKQWISSSTTTCPGCDSSVEKSEGCNHMSCTRCRNHFCYRCGEELDASSPYEHFSATGTPCYKKLFDWQDSW